MVKDIYQKRKERQAAKNTNTEISNNKTNINWYIPTYGKHHSNPYK